MRRDLLLEIIQIKQQEVEKELLDNTNGVMNDESEEAVGGLNTTEIF